MGASSYWYPWAGGFWVGFRAVVGGGFPVEKKGSEKGKGLGRVGDGVGTGKEPASQCARFVETTL